MKFPATTNKFKVGDKVKPIERVGESYDYEYSFTDEMNNIKDELTIKLIGTDTYKVEENSYNWTDAMLEPFERKLTIEEVFEAIKAGKTVIDSDEEDLVYLFDGTLYWDEDYDHPIYLNKDTIAPGFFKILEEPVEEYRYYRLRAGEFVEIFKKVKKEE